MSPLNLQINNSFSHNSCSGKLSHLGLFSSVLLHHTFFLHGHSVIVYRKHWILIIWLHHDFWHDANKNRERERKKEKHLWHSAWSFFWVKRSWEKILHFLLLVVPWQAQVNQRPGKRKQMLLTLCPLLDTCSAAGAHRWKPEEIHANFTKCLKIQSSLNERHHARKAKSKWITAEVLTFYRHKCMIWMCDK